MKEEYTIPTKQDLKDSAYANFRKSIKEKIKASGLRAVRLELDFIKEHPNMNLTLPPSKEIIVSNADMVNAYQSVINEWIGRNEKKQKTYKH